MATIDPITGLPSSNTPSPTTNASTLASGVSPLKIPPVPEPDLGGLASTSLSATDSIIGEYNALNQQQEQAQKAQQQSGQNQLDVMALLSGREAYAQQANEAAGVDAETAKLNDYTQQLSTLNSQAQSLNREAQAIPIQTQQESTGQGRTDRGVAPLQAARLRENALKALSIAQQSDIAAAAATGSALRLQAAKDKAQQIVDLKYKPLEQALELEKARYTLNKDILEKVDKKRAEALNLAIKKEERELADKKAKEKEVSDLIINANIQKAPANIISAANKAKDEGKSALEVANILGVYAGDYRNALLLDERLKTEKLQQAKINEDISKSRIESGRNPVTGKVDTSTPTTFKALTEGQGKDFTYAQRADQAIPKIAALESKVTAMNPIYFSTQMKLASSPLTSSKASPEVRQYYQAVTNFTRAVLRRESGAQIAPSEVADAISTYVGAPGDDAATLAAKSEARRTVTNSFKSNVPQYEQRIQASISPEDKYLDSALGSVEKVKEETSNPYSNYITGLQVRNGK